MPTVDELVKQAEQLDQYYAEAVIHDALQALAAATGGEGWKPTSDPADELLKSWCEGSKVYMDAADLDRLSQAAAKLATWLRERHAAFTEGRDV